MNPIDAYYPCSYTMDNIRYLSFGTAPMTIHEDFKALPNVLEYKGVYYSKSGYNSDSGSMYYREVSKSQLAFPV